MMEVNNTKISKTRFLYNRVLFVIFPLRLFWEEGDLTLRGAVRLGGDVLEKVVCILWKSPEHVFIHLLLN